MVDIGVDLLHQLRGYIPTHTALQTIMVVQLFTRRGVQDAWVAHVDCDAPEERNSILPSTILELE